MLSFSAEEDDDESEEEESKEEQVMLEPLLKGEPKEATTGCLLITSLNWDKRRESVAIEVPQSIDPEPQEITPEKYVCGVE
jgi:hypothetical protein